MPDLSAARAFLVNALVPLGQNPVSQQVRQAWFALVMRDPAARPRIRIVAQGEHFVDLVAGEGDLPLAGWLDPIPAFGRRILTWLLESADSTWRVAIPDGSSGAAMVALFDALEAAWNTARLWGEDWPPRHVEIVSAAGDPETAAAMRCAVNAFWERDPEQAWPDTGSAARVPFTWSCELGLARRDVAGWRILTPAPAGDFPRAPREPRRPGLASGEIGRYFLERAYRHPHFLPGQWDLASRALAGINTAGSLPRGGGKFLCYRLPAERLPGVAVVVAATEVIGRRVAALRHAAWAELDGADSRAVLARVERGDIKLLFVLPELLQDQRIVRTLRHALRKCPGGPSLFVVEEADRASEWSAGFRPAWANLPGAFRDLGEAPIMALTEVAAESVRGDILRQFGVARFDGFTITSDRTGLHVTTPPPQLDFPGYKFEMAEHREQLARIGHLLEPGGFASMPAYVPDLPRWDGGPERDARFRTWLGRLHGLGFIGAFGENARTFRVRQPRAKDPEAYLSALLERAEALLEGSLPGAWRDLAPGDLCEVLLRGILGASAGESRATGLFFERYVAPHLHEPGPIVIAKSVPPDDGPGPETERFLYRLKRLGVVREYFADAQAAGSWAIAVRRFDARTFQTDLKTAFGGLGLPPERLEECLEAAARADSAHEAVARGLESWLKAYYDVHARGRRKQPGAAPGWPGESAAPAESRDDLPTAEEWYQKDLRRDRDWLNSALAVDRDLSAIHSWFAGAGRLGRLRDLAAACQMDDVRPYVLEAWASHALGHPDAAAQALCQALGAAARLGGADAMRRVLDGAQARLRMDGMRLADGLLRDTLGIRELRRRRHDALAYLGDRSGAAGELLAELRSVTAAWRDAALELEPLEDLGTRLAVL